MYYTLQIPLNISKSQKELLLMYERLYHEELERLITCMCMKEHHCPFSCFTYSPIIPKASRWAMYRIADKIAIARKREKQSCYHRSATWSPLSYEISNHSLSLCYGEAFITLKAQYDLLLDQKQYRQLQTDRQLRLDLIHNAEIWYCNILMQYT